MHKLAVQLGRHANADRGFDSYPTPPIAVEALLGVEELPRRNWEPRRWSRCDRHRLT
jgi:hypothetical protein